MCDAARPNDYIPPPGYVPDESERKWASEAQQQDVLFQKVLTDLYTCVDGRYEHVLKMFVTDQ